MCRYIYRPQRSCGQRYVFTRVCDSVHGGGLWAAPPDLAGRTPRDLAGIAPRDLAGRTWQGEPPRDQADPP